MFRRNLAEPEERVIDPGWRKHCPDGIHKIEGCDIAVQKNCGKAGDKNCGEYYAKNATNPAVI